MKLFLIFILVLGFAKTFAQDEQVILRGQITTKKGSPIPNCTVTTMGTGSVTTSDVCGEFTMNVKDIHGQRLAIGMITFQNWEMEVQEFVGHERIIIVLSDFGEMKNKYCMKSKYKRTKKVVLIH